MNEDELVMGSGDNVSIVDVEITIGAGGRLWTWRGRLDGFGRDEGGMTEGRGAAQPPGIFKRSLCRGSIL